MKLVIILVFSALVAGAPGNSLWAAPQAQVANGAAAKTTVWNGVYTTEQALRGQTEYEANCMRCHRGFNTAIDPESRLAGPNFMERWREGDVDTLFTFIKATMPRREPGTLPDAVYRDIVAYLLQANEFPAGTEELTIPAMTKIQIEGADGPKPLPSGALVQVVGCLAQDGRMWLLTNSTEPARTIRSKGSTASEMDVAEDKILGNQIYRVQNPEYLPMYLGEDFNLDNFKGNRMQAKGYVIRDPRLDRLDITSLERIATTCSSADDER